MSIPEPTCVTATEFFQLAQTSDERLELINGEVMVMDAPIPDHQDVSGAIFLILTEASKTIGGKVFYAPLDVQFDFENILQPDLVWIAPNSLCAIGPKRLEGPPDLIVEILSPSTAKRDRDDKFKLYQKHGVREYWIGDPEKQLLDVWLWTDGYFRLQGVYAATDTFNSPVLNGHTIEVNRIFA